MRRHGRVDANQKEIVQTIRGFGASVTVLSDVGCGCPDLVVGYRGHNFLFEVKDNTKPPSQQKLTTDQLKWHNGWRGSAQIIKCPADVVRFLTRVRPKDKDFPDGPN